MAQEKRRAKIITFLTEANTPLTGSELSSSLGVTRQVIVADVAVLRARGEQIIATPRGYLLYKLPIQKEYCSTVAVQHASDAATIAQELYLVVDLGGVVVDVTVEHPLYGELTGNLQIASRRDVEQFVSKMEELQAEPLLVLTDGYHLHKIQAPTNEIMGAIRETLRGAGYLAE